MDWNQLPQRSPLLSETLEGQIVTLLGRITTPITLVCVVDEGPKSQEQAVLLNHIVSMSPQLTLRLLRPGEDPTADEILDASMLPATGFMAGETWCRMVFHGVPGGQELTSFMGALLAAAGEAKELDKPTLKEIGKIRTPAHLQICVSLACSHCAKLVMNAQRIAAENPKVTAHMIDANLYPDLVERYQIQRVPLLLVDGVPAGRGGMTMAELCNLLRKRKP